MIDIPVDSVRDILGEWAKGMTDDEIGSSSLATMIESEISQTCPTWESIIDPDDLDRLDIAIAYLAAARLVANIGGTKSMTLGDQTIAFNADFISKERSRWRRDAFALIGNVCPIPATSFLGIHFSVGRGTRG